MLLGEDAADPFETGLDVDAVSGAGMVFAGQLDLAIAGRDQPKAVTDRLPVVVFGIAAWIPEIALVPGKGTLAAAGQPDWSGAQIGTNAAALGQLPQRQVPFRQRTALGIEGQQKEHRGLDPAMVIQQQIDEAMAPSGTVEQSLLALPERLEIGKQQGAVHALVAEPQHHRGQYRLFVQRLCHL